MTIKKTSLRISSLAGFMPLPSVIKKIMRRSSASHRGDEQIDLLTSADERIAGVVGVQDHEAGRANWVWM